MTEKLIILHFLSGGIILNTEKIESLEQLSGDQRELAEIVGIEAYRKLVENYGGMCIYIYKPETILRERRNTEIFNEFDGTNYRELAKEYGLSEAGIRKIVNKK
ncbi:MAG: hypothetical protein K2G36_08765 [Ruminococcus sp.]|nr:hypothetical protein [Ruminococcus sp.]